MFFSQNISYGFSKSIVILFTQTKTTAALFLAHNNLVVTFLTHRIFHVQTEVGKLSHIWKHNNSSYYFPFESAELLLQLGVTLDLHPFSFSFLIFFSFPTVLRTLFHPLCSFSISISILSTVFHYSWAILPVLSPQMGSFSCSDRCPYKTKCFQNKTKLTSTTRILSSRMHVVAVKVTTGLSHEIWDPQKVLL